MCHTNNYIRVLLLVQNKSPILARCVAPVWACVMSDMGSTWIHILQPNERLVGIQFYFPCLTEVIQNLPFNDKDSLFIQRLHPPVISESLNHEIDRRAKYGLEWKYLWQEVHVIGLEWGSLCISWDRCGEQAAKAFTDRQHVYGIRPSKHTGGTLSVLHRNKRHDCS